MTQEQYPKQITDELIKVNKLTDRLDMPVDPDIKLLVAALHCHGFETTSSCEGHLDRGRGPYVHIETSTAMDVYEQINGLQPGSEDWLAIRDKAEQAGLIERDRLFKLLDEFYINRSTPYTLRLIIESYPFGRSNLTCQAITTIQLATQKTREKWLHDAQQEMNDFANFLIERS
jgi:hypothetical protein